ncbi:hypothetical protein ANI_1_82104 [Paecilomyces variotii No. 5]|uniref:Uncharacterized protein n=1 Tax=Byssochlamys spectabilis (strain No. 5 / NBRC 109023) TaxID=1356009 RepID=V5G8W3_BYSSN|nr:hypothetical protein ANI_1_82104 [Paecilomyces variotii No. 5]
MRLNLVIQRHGLPVTRILWTTSPPSSQAAPAPRCVSSSSALTSTRTPNATYGNGDYTIAQLLEDVNEVIPLETQGGSTSGARDDYDDDEEGGIGQWGLEDYVVEVNGFECLHFMEVEGLLRDGDEVVIRALQLSDMRARRISGRLQISMDGRHLIDGVPFGRPYLKRSFSARPAIKIPPRKRRRISFSGWSAGDDIEEDVQWDFPGNLHTGKQMSLFDIQDDVESDQGTVIRHAPDELAGVQDSDSDADASDVDEGDLVEELNALKEDLRPDETPDVQPSRAIRTRRSSRLVSQSGVSPEQREQSGTTPSGSPSARKSSLVSVQRSASVSESPKRTKNVRFQKESQDLSSSSESETSDKVRESSSEPSDSSSATSSEEESGISTSESDDSTSDSDEESTSESESEASTSESEDEEIKKPKVNPPGKGSVLTKKTNRRNKMRRKLVKLKELGLLPPGADFAALRAFEEEHGRGLPLAEVTGATEPRPQSKEQLEFEAKRQKLLQDLRTGGVDIDGWSEKENVPPANYTDMEIPEESSKKEEPAAESREEPGETNEPSKKRSLDVASSKRLLFGSLGLRTPKSKEEEAAMREKLAAKTKKFVSHREDTDKGEHEVASDVEENWQDKLVVKATECVFDDIELSAPPFPFEQRWDEEAHEIIAERKGWGRRKGRRKRQKIAQQEQEYDNGDWDYGNGDASLNYDDESYLQGEEANYMGEDYTMTEANGTTEETEDLPAVPADVTSLPALVEDQVQSGAVIVFKQLDMSKATNWQPKISEYRVARVDSVLEDKTIKVQLAKRDREQRIEEVDDEEGRRLYSGFEMPGFDEETEEDDGYRELSFAELIEPKLLQAAPSGEGDAQGASLESAEIRAVSDESHTVPADPGPVTVSSQTRNEISTLINDAGFRSKIDSDVLAPDANSDGWFHSIEHDDSEQEGDKQDDKRDGNSSSSSVKSPTFAGFPSSPPDVETNSKSASRRLTPSPTALRRSERNSESRRTSEARFPSQKPKATSHENSTLGYPHLPTQSGGSPRATNDSYEAPVSFQVPVSSDEPTSVLSGSQAESQGTSRGSSTVPNPFYETDRAYEDRLAEQKGDSPVHDIGTEETNEIQETETPQDWTEFDLPPLEVLISTAPARITTTRSPSTRPERRAASSPRRTPPRPDAESESEPTNEDHNPAHFPASEIVDLTQTTSPAASDEEGSDRDFARSQGLPRGPGWVQKNVPPTRRKTRSSTDMALLDGSSLSPQRSSSRRRGRRGRGRGGL